MVFSIAFVLLAAGNAHAQILPPPAQDAVITGVKFNDLNGNGVKDVGEPGLTNWKIDLFLDGNLLDTETTNASGTYAFIGLLPGEYEIAERLKNNWIQTMPAAPGTYAITLNESDVRNDIDFGNFREARIRGRKYEDVNNDGNRQGGEPRLEGWTIELLKDGNVIATSTTNADGLYDFPDLEPGTYAVREIQQAGWFQTEPVANGTYTETPTSGQNISNRDFGNFRGNTIEVVKFEDLDGDGALSAGDQRVEGWEMILNQSTSTRNVIDRQPTARNGVATFENVGPGWYRIVEAPRPGWERTTPDSFFDIFIDVSGELHTTDNSDAVIRFGNFDLGEVHGMKFEDLNGNGQRDRNEHGLEDWEVTLTGFNAFTGTRYTATTTTDADGNYWFMDLPAGQVQVEETQQAGWMQTFPGSPEVPGNHGPLAIRSGSVHETKDFGNFRPGQIHGMKFNDLNGNGRKDRGEPGLRNWVIGLIQGRDIIETTVTDENGNYWFMDLPAGRYQVGEVTRAGWVQTMPADPERYTVNVVSSTVSEDNDFGNFKEGEIHGTKFKDTNGNGVRDGREPGLGRWVIVLKKDGVPFDTAITNARGEYWFMNLGPGEYEVSEVQKEGWRQTKPVNPDTYTGILTSGRIFENLDFGNYELGQIHGMKFHDLNNNGRKNRREPGIPNWDIRVTGVDQITGESVDRTTSTDEDGNYWFMGLGRGNYLVEEIQRRNWIQTFPQNPSTYSVRIGPSATVVEDIDFGNFQPAEIHGMKFNDLNGNGEKDDEEPGIEGWTIELLQRGRVVGSTTTNADGKYWFTELEPGRYFVSEVQQAGWTQTVPTRRNGQYRVDVVGGTVSLGNDFGNFEHASVHGMKFNDLNGNGIKDDGEPGIEGWRIVLRKGRTVVERTRTDADGKYWFMNVGPGTHTIREEQRDGWTQTFPVNPNTYEFTPQSGATLENHDFGNFKHISLHGHKFEDLNGNGSWDDGEPAIKGWKIKLKKNGVNAGSTRTDESGKYWFTDLGPGEYRITEQNNASWIQTVPVNPKRYDHTATSGDVIEGLDFGNYELGQIHGMKFNDLLNNGRKNGNDPGLANWTISINGLDEITQTQVATTTKTDENGNYWFMGLGRGTYVVSEEQQNGWSQTFPNTGTYTVRIDESGTVIEGQSFGNFKPGEIHGIKFHDRNENGRRDGGEEVLPGWEIQLINKDTGQILTTVTNARGEYWFMDLLPARYVVQEIVQVGWVPVHPQSSKYDVSVVSASVLNLDFANIRVGVLVDNIVNTQADVGEELATNQQNTNEEPVQLDPVGADNTPQSQEQKQDETNGPGVDAGEQARQEALETAAQAQADADAAKEAAQALRDSILSRFRR